MIEHIHTADVAVVDISLLNANVFYELGVRHTLRDSVTVLIRRKGTDVPFNIANLNVIEYDETDLSSVEQAKAKISGHITNGLRDRKTDSLVHEVLDLDLTSRARRLTRQEIRCHEFADSGKLICLTTGDIQNVKGVDIWVNSENTNMQMARFYDWAVSSVIRYLGARRDITGHVASGEDDLITRQRRGSLPVWTVLDAMK